MSIDLCRAIHLNMYSRQTKRKEEGGEREDRRKLWLHSFCSQIFLFCVSKRGKEPSPFRLLSLVTKGTHTHANKLMLSFSLLPLLYWSNEIPEYLYKMLCCGRGEKSNDKLNADSSHTNMLVIFVNYSINFSLTTKMNHNEIKKSLSFPFDAAMD